MSKAFVKDENSSILDANLDFDPAFEEISAQGANYITPVGYARLLEMFEEARDERERRQIRRGIDTAQVIDPEMQMGDRVRFGATVTVRDEDEEVRTYRIVGVNETDLRHGKISWISPVAKALIGARVGDAVLAKLPHGEEELEILKVEFKRID